MGGNHQHQSSSMVMAVPHFSPNPIVQLQSRFKEMEVGFKSWLAKQPIHVEVAVVTATSAFEGAAIGGLMGTLCPAAVRIPPASLKQAQTFAGAPLIQARNLAILAGVDRGISCVMKRIRGVEDVQSCMAATFGSWTMYFLVSRMGGPNLAVNAVKSGVFLALVHGGLFKLCQKSSQPDVYMRTKSMLAGLGLQNYVKNFKKGLLTDRTLPLLTDRALRDVKIPPGISRDTELKDGGSG